MEDTSPSGTTLSHLLLLQLLQPLLLLLPLLMLQLLQLLQLLLPLHLLLLHAQGDISASRHLRLKS